MAAIAYSIRSFISNKWVLESAALIENSNIPFFCGEIALCTRNGNPKVCTCSLGFRGS